MYSIENVDIQVEYSKLISDNINAQSRRLITQLIMYSNTLTLFNVGVTLYLYNLITMNNVFIYSNITNVSKLYKVGNIMHINVYLISELKENTVIFFDDEIEIIRKIRQKDRKKKIKNIIN
jgi:hypothetical protein